MARCNCKINQGTSLHLRINRGMHKITTTSNVPVIATRDIEPVVRRSHPPCSDEPSPGGSIAEVVARNQEERRQVVSGGGGLDDE